MRNNIGTKWAHGANNVHNQWRDSEQICSFSLQTTLGVVGQ